MTKSPASWEIWLAKVKFEDNPQALKKRPVLIISPQSHFVLSFKITSTPPRNNWFGEYQIIEWKKAGLKKESTVRTSKHLRLISSDFVHMIGRLEPIDILGIQQILSAKK